MSSIRDQLALAKDRLRIPELWVMLGLPGQPGKSCHVPWREDKNPSGSVYSDGLRFHDHATGEDFDGPAFLARAKNLDIGEACREFIKLAGLEPVTPPDRQAPRRIVATYDYVDESAALLFQVVRFEPKTFRQRRPDSTAPDRWSWKLDGVRRVLYRLPETLAAINNGELIILAEGEKDVGALISHGFAATCNAGGAGKWLDEYTACLRGVEVAIVADKDEPGRNHARFVAGKLHRQAKSVRLLELPDVGGQTVKDAYDYFAAGGTAEDLRTLLDQAPLYEPPAAPALVSAAPTPLPVAEPEEPGPVPFPTACLPPDIALMTRAVAVTHRVPDSLPGLMALAVTSASIGKGLSLDWRSGKSTTPANLFVMLTAESGTGKSECYKYLAAPFLTFERTLIENWRTKTMPQLQADLRYYDGQLKKLDRKLAKESTTNDEADRCRAEQTFLIAKKTELEGQLHDPQLSLQDATVEKVATVMHWNDETIFSTSSDARKLVDNLLGRYSANKNLADDGIYLCAFSGDDVKVDRQGREGVRLANPCLTLLWALQPDALEMLLAESSLQQGGFLARCLIAHTHAAPQHMDNSAPASSTAAHLRWESLINGLLATYRRPRGLAHPPTEPTTSLPQHTTAQTVTASPEACQSLEAYYNQVVDQRRAGDLADVGQYASRWCEQAARLSLVLHAGLHGSASHQHPLDAETAENAIELAKWFAGQQLGLLAHGRHEAAVKREDSIFELFASNQQRKGLDFLTARDVQRARIVGTAEAAHALLDRMESEGLLTLEEINPPAGGRTTRLYRRVTNSFST